MGKVSAKNKQAKSNVNSYNWVLTLDDVKNPKIQSRLEEARKNGKKCKYCASEGWADSNKDVFQCAFSWGGIQE
jgi:hypothetical protein